MDGICQKNQCSFTEHGTIQHIRIFEKAVYFCTYFQHISEIIGL